jgi:hypothetical protein
MEQLGSKRAWRKSINVFQLRDCVGLKPYTRITGLLRGRLAVYMLLNMKESTTWAEILRALY